MVSGAWLNERNGFFQPFANVSVRPILLKNSVSEGAEKIPGPQGLRFISDGGTRDFVLRATKIVLIDSPAIYAANWRLRSRLARNCAGCIFEFFNRIGQLQTVESLLQSELYYRRADRRGVSRRGATVGR